MNNFQSKYKVLEKIGEGSFSEVLKCEERATRICYAAKRLKKNYKSEASITACAEIIAAQKVPYHPNLLNMLEYHYDSFGGRVSFIFELMDMSLHDFLKTKKRGLSEHRVRNYLFQILRGLEHLHQYGLFHRDVKPENILIKFPSLLYAPLSQTNPNEIVKLADLGSVRGIFSAPPYTEYISTRWYRSPECLLTIGNYGPKMDIWAAGCVFYEMLTLNPLFPGCNEIDQLCKIHQVLGSPTIQYMSRLKTKSRNCIFFPKIKGSGIDNLLSFVTRNGRNVLRLMIEYDSEKRVNVKRLLRSCYFDELRESREGVINGTTQIKHPGRYKAGDSIKRSMGDDGSISAGQNMMKKKILKREHYSDELRKSSKENSDQNMVGVKNFKQDHYHGDTRKGSKESSKSGHSSNSSKNGSSVKSVTMPSIQIPYYAPRMPITMNYVNMNNYKVTSLPLVDYKVLKSLGENQPILNNKVPVKNRVLKNRPVKKDPIERSYKTTSNLESVKCHMDIKNILKNQFQSKSFVIPRQTCLHKNESTNQKNQQAQKTSKLNIYR